MKNIVIIDIDTEREKQVRIGKMSDFKIPETPEEDQEVTQLDIKSLVEGLLVMGIDMDEKGYQAFNDTLDGVVEQLAGGWTDYKDKNKNPSEDKE